MSESVIADWLTEPEAADYARCSVWAFRKMRLPAKDSGGRKVYSRRSLDLALEARPWQRSTKEAAAGISTGVTMGSSTVGHSDRLKSVRLKPYAPKKKQNSTG